MKNWIIVLLIFVIPLGLYAFFENSAGALDKNAASGIKNKAKVYKFVSPMCSECKEVDKKLKNIKDNWEIEIEEVNVAGDQKNKKRSKELIKRYDISTVPTLVFVDNAGNLYGILEVEMTEEEIENNLAGIAKRKK